MRVLFFDVWLVVFVLMANGIRLKKGFSTGSVHSVRRLSKEAKGKGIAYTQDMDSFWGPPRFSSSLDMECSLVMDMSADNFDF